ncbi:hypothetical protein PR003_g21842 [Phytophthora rubi]|uniref:Uncharacterized protein n=1 Tax=Phytophthora rubi TaxID=129364 RepID=A0A6A4D908_9STRA|nr:hypothetical protein PR003_g21842 [Phytophthora rubi]
MADQLLHDVDGFLSAQDSNADPDHNLKLEEVDSQQLLADTDALLQSLHTATSVQTKTAKTQILTSETKIKSKQDIAKEKARPASRCLPQATEGGMGNFTATRRGIESKVDQVAATQESAGNSKKKCTGRFFGSWGLESQRPTTIREQNGGRSSSKEAPSCSE